MDSKQSKVYRASNEALYTYITITYMVIYVYMYVHILYTRFICIYVILIFNHITVMCSEEYTF